ncbi:hypothetical protein EON65_42250 [archaeon]|nr:MAG: hypothetical protein EON65_42250 [archaeon]
MSSPDSTVVKSLEPFVVGGSSAMLASSCIHPIDLAKVRLQLFATVNPGKPKPSFLAIIRSMIHSEGFFSIYSGQLHCRVSFWYLHTYTYASNFVHKLVVATHP